MKNLKFSRLFAAVTFVAILALAGCKQPDTSTVASLYGTWVDPEFNSYYKITSTTFENYGDTYESYAGNALTVVEADETSGTIFFKYTRAADANWNYTTDATKAPDIGKWYAVSYKGLSANSIEISGAYKYGGVTSCDTLEEAKTEFTVDNGYFSYYSSCAKQ